jgi:2'-5' RNA ligase
MPILKLIFSLLLISNAYSAELSLNKSVNDKVDFIAHTKPGTYGSYLAMNIHFDPVKKLFHQLDKKLNGKLNKKQARTEAHITVITPVEYRPILEKHIHIKEINEIARKNHIQDSKFEILCLGQGQSKDKNKSTYYLVVKSKNLMKIRKEISNLYIKRGGVPSQFDPMLFYPHITVGYTHRDLHLESDGVKKDEKSCWNSIRMN